MTSNKKATLVFSKYKHNHSSNCLFRVTSMEAGAPVQFLLNDRVWKSLCILNWGAQLNLWYFAVC